jgi:hypothetical protein
MNISMFYAGGKYRGDYAGGTTYRTNDIVKYLGSGYRALKDVMVNVLPTDISSWEEIIEKPSFTPVTPATVEVASATLQGSHDGTRKYWSGSEWTVSMPNGSTIQLNKVYQNCNCHCNCTVNCDCVNNQPNCANCSFNNGDGNACNCACLYQSNCNYSSGNCNCTPNCADGNCYY